ncbi:MAG: hypothetical protein AAGC60_24340 [Acidobacteriota bacterium]
MTTASSNPPAARTTRRDLALCLLVAAGCTLAMSLVLLPLWLVPTRVLAFNDGNLEVVLSPLFAYPESLTRIWNDHVFFGRGEAGIGLTVWGLLETLLGPLGYRRWAPLVAVAFAGAAGVWACRQMGRSRPAAAVAGIFFALCGWTATAPLSGLLGRSLTLCWSLLAIGLLERATRTSGVLRWALYALAGGCVGLAVSDTADVGAFFALAVAAWWLLTLRPSAWRREMAGFALLVVVATLTASHTLVKMTTTELAVTAGAERSADEAWDWATQWSLPIGESLSLVVPDVHGASSRADEEPYWGRVGRTPGWRPGGPGWRHLKLNGYFVGTATVILILGLGLHLWRRRRATGGSSIDSAAGPEVDPDTHRRASVALALAALALALAWGRFFIAYRVFFALPLMDSIRNPEKWLGPMSLFVGLALAFAVDAAISEVRRRPRGWAPFVEALCLLTALVTLFVGGLVRPSVVNLPLERHALAAGAAQRAVLSTLVVLVVLALGARLVERLAPERRPQALAAVLGLAIGGQLLWAAVPYVETVDASRVDTPTPLRKTLDDLETQGRLKLLPARDPVLNNWRLTDLAMRRAPLFDPISVRGMPAEEQALFAVLEDRPVALWALGGVRHVLATPEATAELLAADGFELRESRPAAAWDPRLNEPKDGAASARSAALARRPISLLELTTARPSLEVVDRWTPVDDTAAGDAEVLTRFADPSFDVARASFVHLPDGVTLRHPSAAGPTEAPARAPVAIHLDTPTRLEATVEGPGLLLRTTRFDPRWRVRVGDQAAVLLRANLLFQAVPIPEGTHQVVFDFAPGQGLFVLSLGLRVILVVLAVLVVLAPARTIRSASPRHREDQFR